MRARSASIAMLAAPATAVLLLAACSGAAGGGGGTAGGGASSSAPAAHAGSTSAAAAVSGPIPSDPCSLVSKAEASTVIGGAVAGTLRQGTSCSYENEEHEFAVSLYPHGGDDQWSAALIGLKAQFGKTPALAGLGDKAVAIGGHVVVQTGATVIEVEDTYADKDPQQAHAIAIAKIAVSHL